MDDERMALIELIEKEPITTSCAGSSPLRSST
jgi:hypothetical protein